MSNFNVILDYLGLSSEEASRLLGASEVDVVRWCSTNDAPPAAVWQKLVRIFDQVRLAAEEAAKSADLDRINLADLNRVHLTLPGRDNDPAGPRRAAKALALATLARVFV